jgi:hypothetical protein
MASGTGRQSFVPSWHFVNAADKESKLKYRVHAIRESARRRKWQDEKRQSNTSQSKIIRARPRPWRISKDLCSNGIDQKSDDDWESDDDDDSSCESGNISRSTSSSQKSVQSLSSSLSSSKRQPSSPVKGDSRLQKSYETLFLSSSNPQSILDSGRTNPFDTYPAPNSDQKLDILTDFCKLCTQP